MEITSSYVFGPACIVLCRTPQQGVEAINSCHFSVSADAKGAYHREGRVHYYRPIKSQKDYARDGAQGILDALYDGSIKNFFAALYGGSRMSEEDRESLKEWLDNQ